MKTVIIYHILHIISGEKVWGMRESDYIKGKVAQ